jgi:hypothetical protein
MKFSQAIAVSPPRNSHYGKFYHISECLRPLIFEIFGRTGDESDSQNINQKTAASTTSRGFIVPKKGK